MAMRPNRRQGSRGAAVLRSRGSMGSAEGAITAASEMLNARLKMRGASGGSIGEQFQEEAWHYFDVVPELRTAARITGRAMGQCRLVVARFNAQGEPAPLDFSLDEEGKPNNLEDYNHPARTMLAAFAGGQHGQTQLLDALGVAMTVPGESILVGSLDQENRDTSDDFTRMQAYSTSQVTKLADRVVVKLDDSRSADRPLVGSKEAAGNPAAVVAIRVWRPHPQFNYKADSAARSALPVLREIAGYDEHIEATQLSRLMGAGILWIPEEIELPGIPAADGSDPDGSTDPFLRYFMEVITLAMKDRRSAAALAPILARAAREDIEAIRHMTFSTPFDEKVAENRDKAVHRLGVAVDMPGEILTGYGGLQSWTGALVTDDWKGGYLAELMGFACASLTYGWFYPSLVAGGHGDLESDVIIWYDDSSVRTRENTGPEVQAAYDRGEISGDTLRRVLGFNEGDKPTDEEFAEQVIRMLLLKNPSLASLLFPKFGVTFTEEELKQAEVLKGLLSPTAGGAGGAMGPQPGPSSDGSTYVQASAANVPTEVGASAIPNRGSRPGTAAGAGPAEAPAANGTAVAAFRSVPRP